MLGREAVERKKKKGRGRDGKTEEGGGKTRKIERLGNGGKRKTSGEGQEEGGVERRKGKGRKTG